VEAGSSDACFGRASVAMDRKIIAANNDVTIASDFARIDSLPIILRA
jgi:hypothetical protein